MGWLTAIPIIGKLFEDTAEIVKEVVEDKDQQNLIIGNLEMLGREVNKEIYLRELGTKTVPWVDALHKMGRQILNAGTIVAIVILLLNDIEITPSVALILGGPNAVYQYVKGRGK